MKYAGIVLLTVSLLFTACHYAPYADDFTVKKPKLTDLPGRYYLTGLTVNDAHLNKTDSLANICVNVDGTYTASGIPNVTGNYADTVHKTISASGKWSLDTIGEVARLLGDKWQWGFRLSNIDASYNTVGLMYDSPPYKLIITFDDPDLGQLMIFTKKLVKTR